MNIDNGKIYEFKTDEALALAKEKENLVELEKKMAEDLKQFQEHERVPIYNDLMSPNRQARRKAMRKIAKASKQRNRR